MPALSSSAIAQRLATALDRSDFTEAADCIDPDCHYLIGDEELIGVDAIIASYRESAEWGSHTLDRVIYESEVDDRDGDLSVLYIDRLTHHGLTHAYRCRQHLTLNDAGRIVKIVHEELPGEREQLDAFFAKVGVRRR